MDDGKPVKPEEPDKPVSPDNPSGDSKPSGDNKTSIDKKADKATQTGDQSPIALYVMLCCISICGIAGYVLYMRKGKADNSKIRR